MRMFMRVLLSAVLLWCGVGVAYAASLVANSDFERGLSGWELVGWGDISATARESAGEHRNGATVSVTAIGIGSGAAFVPTVPAPVQTGAVYTFSASLRGACMTPVTTIPCVRESGQKLSIDVKYTMGDGSVVYGWLGSAVVGSEWRTFSASLTHPKGVVSARVYPVAYSVGSFVLDDVSLVAGTVVPAQPVAYLSLDFDDGWRSQIDALPILASFGVQATFNLNTEPTMGGWEAYLTWEQVREVVTAGHVIASHTITHIDLTTVDAVRLSDELVESREILEAMTNASVSGIAYPYGAAGERELIAAAEAGYSYGRGASDGINRPGLTNPYALAAFCPTSETTLAEITGRIDAAVQAGGHLALCFHQVIPDGTAKTPGGYEVTPAELAAIIGYARDHRVAIVPTDSVPGITAR